MSVGASWYCFQEVKLHDRLKPLKERLLINRELHEAIANGTHHVGHKIESATKHFAL